MRFGLYWAAYLPLILLASLAPRSATAFVPGDRWSRTASGATGQAGDPITLSWSFVPDGTAIPGDGTSDLISFLDRNLGTGDGGSDLAQRPWFAPFAQSFDRWSQLSGVTYIYESEDDGATLGRARGALGGRGDVRIGGTFLDGANGTLAYNGLPDDGDMVLDTGDVAFFSNTSNSFRRLRNVVMHEHGHGLGLLHVESDTDAFLMEPRLGLSFDGPQFDDIRGIQAYYGDAYEKSNDGRGNDAAHLATDLGPIAVGETFSIGTGAGPDTRILPSDLDFVSIDQASDIDFYSFGVSGPSTLTAVLTPLGGTFNQAGEGGAPVPFNATAISDLALDLFQAEGNALLATSNVTGVGEVESLVDISLPAAGNYLARVTGTADNIQFYRLDLTVDAVKNLPDPTADFDQDGDVDGDDLLTLLVGFGTNIALPTSGDADFDGDVDRTDLQVWRGQVGGMAANGLAAAAVAPEPASLPLVLVSLAACIWILGEYSKRTEEGVAD